MTDTPSTPHAGMQCPVCRTDLLMSERLGVEIDYCPKCRGVWLDRGELDKIIALSEAQSASAAQPVPAPQPPQVQPAPSFLPPQQQGSPWAPPAPPAYPYPSYDVHGGGHGGHGGGHGGGHWDQGGGFLSRIFR